MYSTSVLELLAHLLPPSLFPTPTPLKVYQPLSWENLMFYPCSKFYIINIVLNHLSSGSLNPTNLFSHNNTWKPCFPDCCLSYRLKKSQIWIKTKRWHFGLLLYLSSLGGKECSRFIQQQSRKQEGLLGKNMHQLIFQKYYPSCNTFLFLLHTLKKKVQVLRSFSSPFFSILHDVEISSLLDKVLCNWSLTLVSLNQIVAHLLTI